MSKRWHQNIAFYTAAAVPVLLSSGCASDKVVSFTSGGMTHTFAEGKDAESKDFPIPSYPGATTTGSVSAQGKDEEQSKFMMLSTADPVEKVADFYHDSLTKDGWSIDKVQNPGAGGKVAIISARKGKLEAQVMAADDAGKTTISLSLGEAGEITKEDTDATNSEDYKPDKVTPPTD